jgi:CHRD domain/PEP-CTERM motif
MKKLKALCSIAAAAGMLALASPAQAVTYVFAAALTGAAEAPPNASTAFGSALVTFDDVALTVSVLEIFAGLSAPASGNHIHCCTAAAGTGTAGVAVNFTGFPNATAGFLSGTFSTFTAGNTFASVLAGAQAGKAYVNVHNAAFPGGEIRGFLVAQVPEPGTYGLMLSGLAAVGLLARRRKSV